MVGKIAVAAIVLLFVVGVGCDDAPTESCQSLPGLDLFHAKWVAEDSVDISISLAYESNQHPGYNEIRSVALRLYHAPSPTGPWVLLYTDTLQNSLYGTPGERYSDDTLRYYYRTPESDAMHFFSVHQDYYCGGAQESRSGPMIVTRRPVPHPGTWQAGPELEGSRGQSNGSYWGAVLSGDGSRLVTSHAEGTIFDMTSGQDVTPESAKGNPMGFTGLGIWRDSLLYVYGRSFSVINTNTFQGSVYISSPFSYPLIDSVFTLTVGLRYYLAHWNVTTHSYHLLDREFGNPNDIQYTSVSPSMKYIACFDDYIAWNRLILLNTDDVLYQPLSAVQVISPFGGIIRHGGSDVWHTGVDLPTMTWGKDDKCLFFWADWSGLQEVWAYDREKDEYKQVTGYVQDAYPGLYLEEDLYNNLCTLNFVYDKQNDRLILFFKLDEYRYAVRYVPVASL